MNSAVYVSLPHFTCGLVTDGVRVLEAAPIMRWAIGRPVSEVRRWVMGKRGQWLELADTAAQSAAPPPATGE